jgi:hypothetical protein
MGSPLIIHYLIELQRNMRTNTGIELALCIILIFVNDVGATSVDSSNCCDIFRRFNEWSRIVSWIECLSIFQ